MNVNPMASSVIYQQSETSIADSNFKSELAKNNVLYQILDSLFVHARIPHIFDFILLLWNTLQIITITFWIPHTNVFLSVHDVNDSNPQNVAIATKVVRYFNAVANLRPLHNSDFELLICVVIYSLVFLLSLGHLIFQIICAKNRGRLINSSLFSTRIFLQFVPGIMNMPTAAMCGTCFRLMLKKDPPIQTYFFFVLLLIQFIYYFLVFSQFFKFMSASVYLNDSCLASFNLSNYSSLISSSAAVQLFAYMFQVFPQWAIYFIVVIHLLVCGLSVPGNLNCMMIHVAANIEILALSATLAEMDIFRIVVIFIKNLPDYVYLIVLAVLLIINFTWSTFYYVSRNKKISNEVKRVISEYSEEDLKKEEIKFLIFEDDFNLGKSESHAINYLNCIVTNYYYQFLDFTIIKYITQTFKSTKTLHYCAKIVAYFPCYTSYLNMLFGELIKRKDLSNDIKFCLFEIQRVKINRTSSSSAAVAESLKMLIQNGREIESNIKYFWTMATCTPQQLCGIESRTKKLQMLWEEEISQYQSSVQHIVDYERFLIECKSDYIGAVHQHYKKSLIEGGSVNKTDSCFAMFIRKFPGYLKKGILNPQGRFIAFRDNQDGSVHNSGRSSGSFHSSSSEMDVQLELSLSKNLFPQARLRIALQRATAGRKPNAHDLLLSIACFVFVMNLVVLIVIDAMFRNSLDGRSETLIRNNYAIEMRHNLIWGSTALMYHFGIPTGFMVDTKIEDTTFVYEPYLDPQYSWLQISHIHNIDGRTNYEKFMNSLIEIAATGSTDIIEYTPQLFHNYMTLSICYQKGGGFCTYMETDIKQAFIYLSFSQSTLTYVKDIYEVFSLHTLCTLLNTSEFIAPAFDDLVDTMTDHVNQEKNDMIYQIDMIFNTVPYIILILDIILLVASFKHYGKEFRKFIKMLLNLPTKVKKESSEVIFKLSSKGDIQPSDSQSSTLAFYGTFIIGVILNVFSVIFLMVLLWTIKSNNIQFTYLLEYSTLSRKRKAATIEILYWGILRVISYGPLVNGFAIISREGVLRGYTYSVEAMKNITQELMTDSAERPAPMGLSATLDELLIKEQCSESGKGNLHESYRCSSSEQMINIFLAQMSNTLKNVEKMGGFVGGEFLGQAVHMLSNHIFPLLMRIDDEFLLLARNTIDQIHFTFDIVFIIGIIFTIISFISIIIVVSKTGAVYQIILTLMRRVPPHALITDTELINYLLNRTTEKNDTEMSIDQRIMYSSKDAILVLDHRGIVESVNPSVAELFGYTPEQLLGQPISIIVHNDTCSTIENQLKLMLNKQSAMLFEDHIDCVADDESERKCLINILATKDSRNNNIDSFVVILRDESILYQQQKQSEEAKKQSEELLYQILPRDIVRRLNQGEKDISFTVPSATIMFIDIVKFSDYASTLTPTEIMANLSLVFGSYDTSIVKYNQLIKIKLIGDVYMVAGGLFDPEEPPKTHAEQMADFAIEALSLLDDVNMKLNSMLSVRIGINTGGPLIAGVLGTDKPTFDIIGDPINIASRLQSTDIAGKIQISQATFELLQGSDYSIEKRGEIMLKGKGKTMTYLLSPQKIGFTTEAFSNGDLSAMLM